MISVEQMEKWLKINSLLSQAWLLAYELEKETDGEIKDMFAKLNSEINNSTVVSYDARDLLKKSL
jgi:hypothetical protein